MTTVMQLKTYRLRIGLLSNFELPKGILKGLDTLAACAITGYKDRLALGRYTAVYLVPSYTLYVIQCVCGEKFNKWAASIKVAGSLKDHRLLIADIRSGPRNWVCVNMRRKLV